ncbi:MAG: hypothetical protein XD97_0227 [Pelotomaculum thermopropionicum]|uniref:Uncharacterized protein n=1 Tax=Pelotomaculum thermopropionicum TaxID=110500 RepID=A0A124FZ55_9FIRM|nr:MAG: hypothetical protein XD97_0227 [Pelotomaculum thermopropionicum]
MSEWRNRQTRTFEGRVGNRAGSSPASDTKTLDFKGCRKKPTAFIYLKTCEPNT